MNKFNKGFSTLLGIIIVVAIILIGGATYYYLTKPQASTIQTNQGVVTPTATPNTQQTTVPAIKSTAPLVWQPDQKIKLCWDAIACSTANGFGTDAGYSVSYGKIATPNSAYLGAVEYCEYLQPNGTTISTGVINYWRLPTEPELNSEIALVPSTFPNNTNYWSSSEAVDSANGTMDLALCDANNNGTTSTGNCAKFLASVYVRCVH
jgi:hypothetical protein